MRTSVLVDCCSGSASAGDSDTWTYHNLVCRRCFRGISCRYVPGTAVDTNYIVFGGFNRPIDFYEANCGETSKQ